MDQEAELHVDMAFQLDEQILVVWNHVLVCIAVAVFVEMASIIATTVDRVS